jgi:hypothetical protein
MTTLSIQIKGANLVRQGLQNLQREIPNIGADQIYKALQRARARVVRYPPPPRRVRWDSERQKRAYFATDGFGGGIPYRRTGTYGRSWIIRRNPRSARVMAGYSLIGNAVQRGRHYSKYVGGDAGGESQSRIHQNRWAKVRTSVEKETRSLPADIRVHIMMLARRKG